MNTATKFPNELLASLIQQSTKKKKKKDNWPKHAAFYNENATSLKNMYKCNSLH